MSQNFHSTIVLVGSFPKAVSVGNMDLALVTLLSYRLKFSILDSNIYYCIFFPVTITCKTAVTHSSILYGITNPALIQQ